MPLHSGCYSSTTAAGRNTHTHYTENFNSHYSLHLWTWSLPLTQSTEPHSGRPWKVLESQVSSWTWSSICTLQQQLEYAGQAAFPHRSWLLQAWGRDVSWLPLCFVEQWTLSWIMSAPRLVSKLASIPIPTSTTLTMSLCLLTNRKNILSLYLPWMKRPRNSVSMLILEQNEDPES